MTLRPGTRLGPYEITALLGAGGMGEVYRATDTNLKRQVAIKVLPAAVAGDSDRLARFQREAEVLAALNHPNIAHIYGLEKADGITALVMELVEGPTLADRIANGAIPIDEALAIARQVAEALEAAHEHGIVHRDLKPANVKVREDGTVKVLDFGLAKAIETSGPMSASVSMSPTITSPAMTQAGLILGTAAYMSPEQAKGRAIDKRSDLWAFGCVLYEMLTGHRAFEGEDVADTIANVLKSSPDWTRLPANLPAPIGMLLTLCLGKDRQQRMADISVARFLLSEHASVAQALAAEVRTAVVRRTPWRRAAILAGVVAATAVIASAAAWLAMRPADPRVARFLFAPPGAGAINVDSISRELAISPDGSHIVYVGIGTAGSQLFVRGIDTLDPAPLGEPGFRRAPFFKPDGQWVGFADVNTFTLKRIAITGGPALDVCRFSGTTRGFTWGDDDNIIFATSDTDIGLQRVSAAGGEPTTLTKPNHERGESDHLWPQVLPGGQAVLFTIMPAAGGIDAAQVALLDLRTGAQTVLIRGGSQARYVSTGHLIYTAAGTLQAVGFDLGRKQMMGTPIPVVSQVATAANGTAKFDVAGDGTLVYLSDSTGATPMRTLVWVDRQGHEDPINAPARAYVYARISPDATRVALDIRDQEQDIWILNLASGALDRRTFDPGLDRGAVWMPPDGKRILYSSEQRGGAGNVFWQAADGSDVPERLTQSAIYQFPSSVTRDGTQVVFSEASDLMLLTMDKDHRVRPLFREPRFGVRNGEISPDGRWLAYEETNKGGQVQISVRPFPDVTAVHYQVSTSGGSRPLWSPNGQELFYLAPSGAVMSVGVGPGASWMRGETTTLFDGSAYAAVADNNQRAYDVSPDGKRFLMIKQGRSDQPATSAGIIVVQNWFEELKRLVPAH